MKNTLLYIAFLFSVLSCKNESSTNQSEPINTGNDPNFSIIAHSDDGFNSTNRKVVVFGIPIYAFYNVEDTKLLHAANIMAQYLDNNEDGIVDNQMLLTTLLNNEAALFMWKTESQINLNAQDLGADETIPIWHTNGQSGQFDATLEEVWHVITYSGYSDTYPEVFGENSGTSLTNAMDIARGGNFTSIPDNYPNSAWYTYDDQTCDYQCMATEYFYWGLTSILGAQENRLNEISQEWDLNTRDLVESTDTSIYELLTNPIYKFPTILPDGKYMH
ncbi:hypothetical protein OAA78_03725 [Flavobacteriaceae bacterium]|nr:hypothetical protein [Flavobacteriaceae bacterium]MDB9712776.1 hypothetical protein [Flavobacteriaceae bacterium]MDC1491763.1 hypothetical protein [Flavobacteriaceae bacterium]